jgi:hypothetical protein
MDTTTTCKQCRPKEKWYISLDNHPEKYVVREEQDALNIIGGISAFDLDATDSTFAVIYRGDTVVKMLEKCCNEWYFVRIKK